MIPLRLATSLCVLALALGRGAVCRAASPGDARRQDGERIYATYCLTCHGARMEGYGADNAPSLASPTFRDTASDAFLRAAIERGRAGTAMAGYGRTVGGPLAPGDVDALLAYIRSGAAAPKSLPRKPSTGSATKGRQVYADHCQSCHGTAEQRSTAVHLANAMFLASASDAFLRAAIVRGRPGTPMEAWGAKLSPPEIEDVVAYVRSLARAVPRVPPQPARATAPAGVVSIDGVPVLLNPAGEPASFSLREDRYVSVADVAKAYDEKRRLVIVDARTPSDYLRLHIAGAVSIPYFDMHELAKIPNDGTWVVAYCACPHHVSGIVVDELRKRGYPHTAVLDEGVFLWQQQGHPVDVANGQLPIAAPPPQGALMPLPRTLGDDEQP